MKKRVKGKVQKNWWLFHATDFQTLMYPCIGICRIFGMFPYKINNSIFEASKRHYILSVTITCALCVYGMRSDYYMFANNFEGITMSLGYLFYNITMNSLLIATFIWSSSRMRLLRTIMEISSRLSPESYRKLCRLIHVKDILGSFYLIGILFIYMYKKDIDALTVITGMYTLIIVFQWEMLYMNCVCLLKNCFKEINDNLLHVQELVVNNKLPVCTMFYHKHRNPFLIMKIKALKKQHIMISNTVQTINMSFSFQLLTTAVVTISVTTFELYSNMIKWDNGIVINLKEIPLLLMIFFVIKMTLIVWACETAKDQAGEIQTTIHGILNRIRDGQIKDELSLLILGLTIFNLTLQLHLFSLQTLHCGSTFSAKFFSMDAKFLATMASTITTYMLISLQFLIMTHSCDEKSTVT